MLRKFSFLVVMIFINFSVHALEEYLEDAQVLAQGHSEENYVNPERVTHIMNALTAIRRTYPIPENIHAQASLTVSIELPYIPENRDLYQIDQITAEFNGAKKIIGRFRRCDKTCMEIRFPSRVEIASMARHYKKALGDMKVYHTISSHLSCSRGFSNIILETTPSQWIFIFDDGNVTEFRKEYKVIYDLARSSATDCKVITYPRY